MATLYSDEWLAMVLERAASLPEVEGVSFVFDAEITEAPGGKFRACGRVVDGRLVELGPGKNGGDVDAAAVQFAAKAKRFEPIVRGEIDPLVAYMRGELKIDGNYELVIDDLANRGDRAAFAALRAEIASATD